MTDGMSAKLAADAPTTAHAGGRARAGASSRRGRSHPVLLAMPVSFQHISISRGGCLVLEDSA